MPTITIPTIDVSKTTLFSYLNGATILFGGVAVCPGIPHNISAVSGTISALCGIWMIRIGHIMKDAGEQQAYVPGQGVKEVPSHEVPDSPSAIPVVK